MHITQISRRGTGQSEAIELKNELNGQARSMLDQKPLHLGRRLCKKQANNGSWSAFELRPGGSDTWTTSCCLRALEQLKAHSQKEEKAMGWLDIAINGGWKFLEENKSTVTGIGFNALTPNDADSSIWLCRSLTAKANNCTEKEIHKIEDQISELLGYIKDHQSPCEKKISTYNMSDKILEFVNIRDTESAWLKGHDCVTANAEALASELKGCQRITIQSHKTNYLKNLVNDNSPYWWSNKSFCKIILNQEKISRKILPRRLTLRVPNHDDLTGDSTQYYNKNDIEMSIAFDNGIFEDCLRLINLLRIE